jgi:hypothetical protein
MLLSPVELNKFYDCLAVYEAMLLRATHDLFSRYCNTFLRMQRGARGTEGIDAKLYELLSPFRRFMYDAESAPIPFSSSYYDGVLPEGNHHNRIRNELNTSYRQLLGLFDELLAIIRDLRSCSDNPLLDRIGHYAKNTQVPLVVRRQRYIEFVQQAANSAGLTAEVTLPGGVRPGINAEIGFAVGFAVGRTDQFPEILRRVPMAQRVVFVEYDWIKKMKNLDPIFIKPFVYSPLPDIKGSDAIKLQDFDEQDFVLGEKAGINELREYALRELHHDAQDSAESEGVTARLAFFENGWMAFLSADDSARYNVVQARDGSRVQIVRKRIRELQTEDPLVLRLGSLGRLHQCKAQENLGP